MATSSGQKRDIYMAQSARVPIANSKGWADISQRADMMRRFAEWERKGKTPVLLYCGDHDPAGLAIKNHLRTNLRDLSKAVGWSPDNLIVDRYRGIKTWVSLEPVIDPDQALQVIRELHSIVGHWKVGKINYQKDIEVDWIAFREEVKALLDRLGADYYLKKSLTNL
jgi:hypothetical protein